MKVVICSSEGVCARWYFLSSCSVCTVHCIGGPRSLPSSSLQNVVSLLHCGKGHSGGSCQVDCDQCAGDDRRDGDTHIRTVLRNRCSSCPGPPHTSPSVLLSVCSHCHLAWCEVTPVEKPRASLHLRGRLVERAYKLTSTDVPGHREAGGCRCWTAPHIRFSGEHLLVTGRYSTRPVFRQI